MASNSTRAGVKWKLFAVNNADSHVEECANGFKWELTLFWQKLASGVAPSAKAAWACIDSEIASILEEVIVELRAHSHDEKRTNECMPIPNDGRVVS